MIIKPLEELVIKNKGNKIKANKSRINLINTKHETTIDLYFDLLATHLEDNNAFRIQMILENNLYFEEISPKFIKELIYTFNTLPIEYRKDFIEALKSVYKSNGTKGVYFTIGGVMKSFKSEKWGL